MITACQRISGGIIMSKVTVRSLFFISFIISFNFVVAAYALDMPGVVPKQDSLRSYANDLADPTSPDEVLTHDKLNELVKANVDLSKLDPRESDIWKKNPRAHQVENQGSIAKIDLKSGDGVTFASKVISPSGVFRFNIYKDSDEGRRNYIVYASKKVHNNLLRKALLEKLGYYVPDWKYLPKLKVHFDSVFDKEVWVNDLKEAVISSEENRWIVENNKETDYVILQDVVVSDVNLNLYNLATGYLTDDAIAGYRSLNSLLVPFSLVEVPESVNLLAWYAAIEVNNGLSFACENVDVFSPSYSDAKWITRRILKLTSDDWAQIVNSVPYPKEVAMLLIEKLKSRRDSLIKHFGLENEFLPLGANTEISSSDGKFLKDGKLLKQRWDGFASRFAFDEPETPLTTSEILALIKSKAISAAMSNVVNQFNTNILPHVDLAAEAIKAQKKIAQDSFLKYLSTGRVQETNFGAWTVPTYGIKINADRKIVAGSYMGTDNLIQLADSIGISLDAGIFAGGVGLPTNVSLSANAKVSYNRRYAHLRPIASIKQALKTPYKNLLVPLTKNEFAKELDKVVAFDPAAVPEVIPEPESTVGEAVSEAVENVADGAKELVEKTIDFFTEDDSRASTVNSSSDNSDVEETPVEDEEAKLERLKKREEYIHKKLVELMKKFKENFSVGDSLVVTDSLGGMMAINGGYRFTDILKAQATFDASQLMIKRLHITRKSENEIHIYEDEGDVGKLGLKVTVKAYMPIVTVGIEAFKGEAKTKFYTLNINENLQENPNFLQNVRALRLLLDRSNMDYVEEVSKPFTVAHEFNGKSMDASLFHIKWKWLQTADKVTVTHKDDANAKKNFYRFSKGKRKGKNYQDLLFDGINAILTENGNEDISIPSDSDEDPANTFKGSSLARNVLVEGEISETGFLDKPFLNVNYRWKGFKIDRAGAEELLADINKKYNSKFVPKNILSTTDNLQLYTINLNLFVYQRAFDYMTTKIKKDDLINVFTDPKYSPDIPVHRKFHDLDRYDHSPNNRGAVKGQQKKIRDLAYAKFKDALNDYRDAKNSSKDKLQTMSKKAVKMISIAEELLNVDGLRKLFGGENCDENGGVKNDKLLEGCGTNNFLIQGKINGFREGVEDGDGTLVTDSIGEVGDIYSTGPMTVYRNRMGMSDAEFYASWIIGRL